MDRNIFSYHNGIKTVYVDPLAVLESVYADSPKFGRLVEQTKSQEFPDWSLAIGSIAETARRVFDLPDFNQDTGEGWTRKQCFDLMREFLNFVNSKKKEWRMMADLLSSYHLPNLPIAIDYTGLFGLWLNIPRVGHRHAYAVWQGTEATKSNATIPWEWFAAVGLLDDVGEEMFFDANEARAMMTGSIDLG